MNDPQLDDFEVWFKKQIASNLPEDAHFTSQVLTKLAASQKHSRSNSETWTSLSWLVCMVAVATVLMQFLSQIDTETLSGPILESLALILVLLLASWQCQVKLALEFE